MRERSVEQAHVRSQVSAHFVGRVVACGPQSKVRACEIVEFKVDSNAKSRSCEACVDSVDSVDSCHVPLFGS